jgi:hypothetical protein
MSTYLVIAFAASVPQHVPGVIAGPAPVLDLIAGTGCGGAAGDRGAATLRQRCGARCHDVTRHPAARFANEFNG